MESIPSGPPYYFPIMMDSSGETTSLLSNSRSSCRDYTENESDGKLYLPSAPVLPLALFSALAMSSTSATAYFTYVKLLCKNPTHCEDHETNRFATYVAAVTTVSNVSGMIALGPLQRITKTKLKLVLTGWIVVRSMSALMLLLGMMLREIHVALCNKIFEGVASDNILHFALNTAYAQNPRAEKVSYFIGYSLALYMIGISTSPFVAGLFEDSSTSCFAAITLFAVAAVYLKLFIHPRVADRDCSSISHLEEEYTAVEDQSQNSKATWKTTWETLILPLHTLARMYSSLFYGLSLLAYNIVQSYIFNALLVHTSVKFGFTGRNNGFLISLVHSIGAMYILMSLYVVPKTARIVHARYGGRGSFVMKESTQAIFSLLSQALSLISLSFVTEAWQVYLTASLLALGLPTPSFIKSNSLKGFQQDRRTEILAALAMMETMGDVLGPIVLGGWQSYSVFGGGVFILASGFVLASLGLFVCGLLLSC